MYFKTNSEKKIFRPGLLTHCNASGVNSEFLHSKQLHYENMQKKLKLQIRARAVLMNYSYIDVT